MYFVWLFDDTFSFTESIDSKYQFQGIYKFHSLWEQMSRGCWQSEQAHPTQISVLVATLLKVEKQPIINLNPIVSLGITMVDIVVILCIFLDQQKSDTTNWQVV